MMNKDELNKVNELALKSSLFTNPKASFLAEGFGNLNFLLEENDKKFVLRIKKDTGTLFSDSLRTEYIFLKYFELKGIQFCPKALYYDEDDNFLIESYIPGKIVSQKDFSKNQIELFAKQLYRIESLSVADFAKFYKENNYGSYAYRFAREDLDQYGFERYAEVDKKKLSIKVQTWIEAHLQKEKLHIQKLNELKEMVHFSWGDVQPTCFIDDEGEMYFYDFEHVSIGTGSDMTYIKIHGAFDSEQFAFLLDRYCDVSEKNKKEVLGEIKNQERLVRTNDVVWAAAKLAHTQEKEFEDLMHARIKLVEDMENM